MDIGAYTLRTWGKDQTLRYIDDLEACCQRLADNPSSGRPCDRVRPGLRRMEQGRHVVFFRREPGGVLVSRSAAPDITEYCAVHGTARGLSFTNH